MNKQDTLEAIKIMQHFVDGGEVQFKVIGGTEWHDIGKYHAWNFRGNIYRIKPKPREWEVEVIGNQLFPARIDSIYEKVKVREVIDE